MKEKYNINMKNMLTTCNFYDKDRTTKDINGIVIHYTESPNDTPENECTYFKGYRGASAHVFVKSLKNCAKSVRVKDVAWHCGASSYKSGCNVRNTNSIGIEMCCKKMNTKSRNSTDLDWYVEPQTLKATACLVAFYMKKYNISLDNVVRHYDVTGKACPAFMITDKTMKYYGISGNAVWKQFKKTVKDMYANAEITVNGKLPNGEKATSEKTETKSSDSYKITASALRLRKSPVDGNVLVVIPNGKIVNVTDKVKVNDKTWGKTKFNGISGYICLTNYTKSC